MRKKKRGELRITFLLLREFLTYHIPEFKNYIDKLIYKTL